jgi:hypothetical protein
MPQLILGVNGADRWHANVEHEQRHRKCKHPVAERGQTLEGSAGDLVVGRVMREHRGARALREEAFEETSGPDRRLILKTAQCGSRRAG